MCVWAAEGIRRGCHTAGEMGSRGGIAARYGRSFSTAGRFHDTQEVAAPSHGLSSISQTGAGCPGESREHRRYFVVVPLIGDKRCYGEAPMSLRRDCRPIRGNGPGGWRRVGSERPAFWGSQPWLARSGKAPPIWCPAVLLCRILCSPHTKGGRLATQGTAVRLLPVRSLI